ncbi:MAG: hypothetical protein LBN37_00960 [Bacteroidales bacterium]|jgi:hypothetical protein|nr:hypothetical protein [Bacteroidales bacterium]
MEDPLLVMLADNVAKWKNLIAAIEQENSQLKAGEDTAYEGLRDHWMFFDFDPTKCSTLLDEMAKYKAKHIKGKFLENLQEFRGLCKGYYTKDKAVFEAFQKAMGGKKTKQPPKVTNTVPKPPPPKTPPPPPTNGAKRIDYDSGDYYIGDIVDGRRHGAGEYHWTNGDWYKGQWVNGERTGQGTYYFASTGETDIGQFLKGKKVGSGTVKWKDGSRYEGTWDDTSGKLNGTGIYYFAGGTTERGSYVNGTWVRAQTTTYTPPKTTTTYTSSNYSSSTLSDIGSWIWENLMWFPWFFTGLAVVITWIGDGFGWNVIGVAVGGAIASTILMFVIEFVKPILEWLWDNKWVPITIIAIIILSAIWRSDWRKNLFSGGSDEAIPVQELLVPGKWEGSFNNKNVVLEFTSVNGQEVNAVIHLPQQDEQLKGSINGSDIALDDVIANGYYDGKYSGTLDETKTVLEGYYLSSKQEKIPFKFTKKE